MSGDQSAGKPGFFARLKSGLSRSANALGGNLIGLFSKKKLDAQTIAELEEALVRADIGTIRASNIAAAVARGRYDSEISEPELRTVLAREIAALLRTAEVPLAIDTAKKPFVILVIGVPVRAGAAAGRPRGAASSWAASRRAASVSAAVSTRRCCRT